MPDFSELPIVAKLGQNENRDQKIIGFHSFSMIFFKEIIINCIMKFIENHRFFGRDFHSDLTSRLLGAEKNPAPLRAMRIDQTKRLVRSKTT